MKKTFKLILVDNALQKFYFMKEKLELKEDNELIKLIFSMSHEIIKKSKKGEDLIIHFKR